MVSSDAVIAELKIMVVYKSRKLTVLGQEGSQVASKIRLIRSGRIHVTCICTIMIQNVMYCNYSN